MQRKLYLMLALVAMLLLPTACDYDDCELRGRVDDLENRVDNLEEIVNKLNKDVTTLSQLMNGKKFITSVEDKGDGTKLVHFVTTTGETSFITITDGKDGEKGEQGEVGPTGPQGPTGATGATGADGQDGQDGATPVISVRQDSDGNWYWTLNGEWLIVDGQKVRANGIDGANGVDGEKGDKGDQGDKGDKGDQGETGPQGPEGPAGPQGPEGPAGPQGPEGPAGQDGQDGQDGKDGVAPTFRIENGRWLISFDRGLTWQDCGQATGADGDAFFKDAQLSPDGKVAYLTLIDGTVVPFAIYNEFGISFDLEGKVIREGETATIDFTVTGMTAGTQIEVLGKNGWDGDATLDKSGKGKLTVTAPDKTGLGKVIVLLSDGGDKTIMRTLSFIAGTVKASTQSVEVPTAGGSQTVTVQTNLDFTVSIPEEAQSWISTPGASRADALRTETFTVKVEASDSPSPRQSLISLLAEDGSVAETVLIVQKPIDLDPKDLVFRVDPSIPYNGQVTIPIYAVGSTVTIDWGDGSTTEITSPISTANRNPKHTYADNSQLYTVIVKGNVTNLNGTSSTYTQAIVDIAQWGTANQYTQVILKYTNAPALPEAKGTEFAAVTKFDFGYNYNLVNVSPKLFHGTTNKLTSLGSLFYNCSALKSVPQGLFDETTYVKDIQKMFYGCEALTDLPEDLLYKMPSITNPSYLFQNCKSLRNVPAGFMSKSTQVTSLQYFFSGCESLEYVPEDFFQAQKAKVTTLNYTFQSTKNLKTLPAKLFDGFNAVTNVQYMFNKATGLEELPEGFFDFATQVTNFMNCFDGCTNLRKLGSGFRNNFKNGYTGTTQFSLTSFFRDCENLTDLPADFFTEVTMQRVNNFNSMFMGCNKLTAIPAEFFKGLGYGIYNNQPIKPNANMAFRDCESLTSLPFDILFNTPGMLMSTNYSSAFNGCKNLTGTVPTYKLTVGDKTYDVAPWQRVDYIKSTDTAIQTAAKAVFGTSSSISSSDCFTGAEKITGWAKIPASWGGGDDGIYAKPELTVEAKLAQGQEYYNILFDLHGTEVTKLFYTIATTEWIDANLPRYQNSLEEMVRKLGVELQDDWNKTNYTALNSEVGLGLYYDECTPETEYAFLTLVENSKGYAVNCTKIKTQAMPKGSDAYEQYIGSWTVKPAGTSVETYDIDDEGNPVALDTPAPTFDITVAPYRVDSLYTLSGWGYTIFNEHEIVVKFNKETNGFEIWNAPFNNFGVMQNYQFGPQDNPDAKFSNYNVVYYGIVEDPKTYQYNFASAGTGTANVEPMLAGSYIPAANRMMMMGQRSSYNSSVAYGDVYWSGIECLLTMGYISGSQYWTPVQVVRPEYRFNHKGKEYTLYQHGPYTLTKNNSPAKARRVATDNAVANGSGILKVR